MIVDVDTRIWTRLEELGEEIAVSVRRLASARWVQPDATVEAHGAATRAVDASIVVGFRSELLRGAVAEEALRPIVERSEGRVFLARAVDPLRSGAAAEVESARRDGVSAIWMDPATQGFNPSDTRAMRVFDRAEANQLPVLLGWSGPQPASARLEFGRPYLLDEVARAFPRLSLVIGGFGAPFAQETLALLAKHDRVYTHTGGIAARPWELLHGLQMARDMGVDSRILFASGFPFDTPARAIESIYGVNSLLQQSSLPRIARSLLREIVERDSISLLGLGAHPAPRDRAAPRSLASDGPLRLSGDAG
ncbi:MAG: amidohydrolase family protein [Phycisphaera sp.]|nr:amidohydrolase family protein [Phycisphaera sp.]